MSTNHYTLHTTLLLLLAFSAPLMAQKRIVTDERSSAGLATSDSRHFTQKDAPKNQDRLGLMSTDYAGNRHLLGFWVNGSYSSVLHDMTQVEQVPGGFATGLGFVYEFQHNYFMLQTGVGATFQDVKYFVSDYSFTNHDLATMWDKDARWLPSGSGGQLQDSYGLPIDTLRYSVTARRDIARTLYVQVPILLGGNINGFFGMAGVKLNMAVWGNSKVTQNVTSTAIYTPFIGTHEEMDNHGYRYIVPLERKGGQVPFKMDVMASAEVGYEFHVNTVRYRLAAFADYGLLNINPNGSDRAFYIDFDQKWNFDRFDYKHAFASEWTEGKKMHNLFAGIKFTMLFDLPPSDKCILCQLNKRHGR